MRLARLLLGTLAAACLTFTAGAGASPKGGFIAFSRCGPDGCGSGTDIWLIRQDGSGLRRVTREGTHNEFPSWSPDGKRLAFARSDGVSGGIWTLNLSAAKARRLTSGPALDEQPAWSPDSKRIAFVRELLLEGGSEIDVVAASGYSLSRLTHGLGDFRHPSWSPDGRRLAFAYSPSPKTRRYRIYVVQAKAPGAASWAAIPSTTTGIRRGRRAGRESPSRSSAGAARPSRAT